MHHGNSSELSSTAGLPLRNETCQDAWYSQPQYHAKQLEITKHDCGGRVERQHSLLLVKLVEAAASLLSKALVVIEQRNDLCRVHSLWEGLYEVLAHMQANVSTNQVTQPASPKQWLRM